jgi:undecaprenyl-diphosphatase
MAYYFIMSLLQVVVLALVQGITEFLPISSSAHLALTPWLLGWKDQGLTYDVALHFGTLLAVLIYFFRDWLQILAQGFRLDFGYDPELKRNPKLLWLLVIGTVPIGVCGLLFKGYVETALRSPFVIGGMLIGVALVMDWSERAGRKQKGIDNVSLLDTVAVGIAQALAIVPGTSRSGITIAMGLFRNLDRHTAARFSFLLSTPAVAAAALKDFLDLHAAGGIPEPLRMPFLIGVALSALTGCLVIGLLLRYLRRESLRVFVYYRIVFGIIILALASFRHPTG